MRIAALILAAATLVACDKDEPQNTQQKTQEPKALVIPVSADAFLVVERTGEAEAPFPTYTTYQVVADESGVTAKQDFAGFQIAANGRNWSWNVEEKVVDGSRDCACETFPTEGCTSETTMMVAELSQQGKEQRWRPPVYTTATRGLASWRTSSARASVRGDLLFTSVCLEVMKCGETPRPVCQATVWSVAGEAPKVIESDTLATPPQGNLLADALAVATPRSKAHQALSQATEASATPVLVEVQPTFEGKVTQRWVVPSDIRASGDWTAYTWSVMHEGEAAGQLKPFAPLPRAVSIFTNKREGAYVGWSAESGE
jgi:hypothetical protein